MKKKLLSVVLAATMAVGLAGCGGSGDNAAESTGSDLQAAAIKLLR